MFFRISIYSLLICTCLCSQLSVDDNVLLTNKTFSEEPVDNDEEPVDTELLPKKAHEMFENFFSQDTKAPEDISKGISKMELVIKKNKEIISVLRVKVEAALKLQVLAEIEAKKAIHKLKAAEKKKVDAAKHAQAVSKARLEKALQQLEKAKIQHNQATKFHANATFNFHKVQIAATRRIDQVTETQAKKVTVAIQTHKDAELPALRNEIAVLYSTIKLLWPINTNYDSKSW